MNRAFFLATGYGRDEYRQFFLRCAARMTADGDQIDMKSSTNGLLLRAVIQGDEAGVRVSLRNPSVNVNAFGAECFKQAIFGNHLRIAGILYYAGTDMAQVAQDDAFMHKVSTASHGVTDLGRKLVHQMIRETDRKNSPTLTAVA